MRGVKRGVWCGAAVVVAAMLAVGGLSGCSTLDRAYKQEVTWTNAPVVRVFTNTVVLTNTVPVVMERTNIVYVTNAATGAVSGYMSREPVATNLVTAVVTNLVPVFYTNVVQVSVTNLVAKPEAEAVIQAAGSVVNMFAPGVGSIVALALGGAVSRLPTGPESQGQRGAGRATAWIEIDANAVTRASLALDPWPITAKPENFVLIVAGGGHPTNSWWLQGYSPRVLGRLIQVPETFEELLTEAARDLGCGSDYCRV